jgi:hypothetical protein
LIDEIPVLQEVCATYELDQSTSDYVDNKISKEMHTSSISAVNSILYLTIGVFAILMISAFVFDIDSSVFKMLRLM